MSLTPIQWVRYRIGDTGDTPHFTDGDLEAYLEIEAGDRAMASARALEAWATQLAAAAHDVMLGDYRENTAARAQAMRQAAKALREEAASDPAFAVARTHTGPGTVTWRDAVVDRVVRGDL